MPSPSSSSSSPIPLLLIFLAGAATATASLYLTHHLLLPSSSSSIHAPTHKDQNGKDQHTHTHTHTHTPNTKKKRLPSSLEKELFARVISFFGGDENFATIQESFVIVVGLGGVGSHAAHMLVRSGVRKLRLIDFDQITLSSLNRHAVATLADVGQPKAEVLKQHLHTLIPGLEIESINAIMTAESAPSLLAPLTHTDTDTDTDTHTHTPVAFVLDCIDDVTTKAALLLYCQRKNLRVVSSLGAGLKADPTRICIGDLATTTNEPLAVKLRYMLKKQGRKDTYTHTHTHTHDEEGKSVPTQVEKEDTHIHTQIETSAHNITTIYSHEKPKGTLLPLTQEQEAAPAEFGVVDNFRIRVLPVLGTMPALFGQAMAAYVVCELAGQPLEPVAVEQLSRAVKHRLLQHLRNRERKFHNNDGNELTREDIEEVVQEVWRCRCVATNQRLGTGQTFVLARYKKENPPTVDNLLLFASQTLADRYEEEGESMLSVEAKKKIDKRLQMLFG